MNNTMLKLPVGISSFEKIRKEGYLYIDKTEYIYQLIDRGIYYFLARPRRFGKSLLVSTLRCLFDGKKELFEGLWIYDKWDWEKRYPVILVDFNEIKAEDKKTLEEDLIGILDTYRERYSLFRRERLSLPRLFKKVIVSLSDSFSSEVVCLIDEYDRPIINHIGLGGDRLKIAKDNREILKEFYGVLKESHVTDRTKFVLLTGVSKFSRVSVFSELNNLSDITMDRRYAEILGITEDELDRVFLPYLKRIAEEQGVSYKTAREKLKAYYNGYRFSRRDVLVYNPFSLLRCLDEYEFQSYWFETGTPTFLVNLIREKDYPITNMEHIRLKESVFSTYELENLSVNALLFQTGYLTIKDVRGEIYTLSYPNTEVKKAFNEHILRLYTGQEEVTTIAEDIREGFEAGDIERVMELMKGIYGGIPYTLIGGMGREGYYHSIFYSIIQSSGLSSISELLTAKGRVDMVIQLSGRVYIIEFKCNQSADIAIAQIREKGYADRFIGIGKEIVLVGINFSTEKRNIDEWKVEKLSRQ